MTARRRGVTYPRRLSAGISAAASLSRSKPDQIFDRAALHPRRNLLGQQFEQQLGHRAVDRSSGAGRAKLSQHALGERPYPQDVGGALGYADRTARVEQVEEMARL